MNTKTKRIKKQKDKCSCKADFDTHTIFLCDNCAIYFDTNIICVPEADRIGNKNIARP